MVLNIAQYRKFGKVVDGGTSAQYIKSCQPDTTKEPKMFTTITSRLGVHVNSSTHATQRAAELAARKAIAHGDADSAAIWTATEAVAFLGTGR
jgi:hypothetical protein